MFIGEFYSKFCSCWLKPGSHYHFKTGIQRILKRHVPCGKALRPPTFALCAPTFTLQTRTGIFLPITI